MSGDHGVRSAGDLDAGSLSASGPGGDTSREGAPREGAPTVLERILHATREEVARRKRELPIDQLERDGEALAPRRSLHAALAGPGVGVIAEFKRRSPSAGRVARAARGR